MAKKDIEKIITTELSGDTLFSKVFTSSPIGLVLLDDQTKMFNANEFIFSNFGIKKNDYKGKQFGNVFHCSEVHDSPLVCGTANACSECKLRNGVQEVLKTNKELSNVVLSHEFTLNSRKTTKWFTISASPITHKDITYGLVSFVDITDRINTEERLREIGIKDDLTNLYNRRYVNQLLPEFIRNSQIENMTLVLLDIDDFKKINDKYGHSVGDEILKLLSQTMIKYIRTSDHICRYGGEEFLVLFTSDKDYSPEAIIERVQKYFKVETKQILGYDATFSAGVVNFHASDEIADNLKVIIDKADELLYKVKATGKNAVLSTNYKKTNN